MPGASCCPPRAAPHTPCPLAHTPEEEEQEKGSVFLFKPCLIIAEIIGTRADIYKHNNSCSRSLDTLTCFTLPTFPVWKVWKMQSHEEGK